MSLYAVVDPKTGDVVREYPTATDEQIEQALASASKAYREWSKQSTVAQRADLIRKVGELHTERREELAEIIAPRDGQADRAGGRRGRLQRRDLRVLRRQRREVPGRRADRAARRRRQRRRSSAAPSACCSGIMPWNYPYYQVAAIRRTEPDDRQHRRCSSTRRSAPSRPRRSRRSSTTPVSPRAPTSTSMPPTSRSPRSSPTRGCRVSR